MKTLGEFMNSKRKRERKRHLLLKDNWLKWFEAGIVHKASAAADVLANGSHVTGKDEMGSRFMRIFKIWGIREPKLGKNCFRPASQQAKFEN
jgi:hypothetical protein